MKRIDNQTFDMERALYGQSELLVKNCSFDGPADGESALKECSDVRIYNCDIISPEFGWSVQGICMEDSMAVSEYFMMRSEDLAFRRVQFQGKYSFQYIKNAVFEDCVFDTKDAFWHGIPII